MSLYKLTDQEGRTHGGYFYGQPGLVHEKTATADPKLCSKDVFHAYLNKNLAFLLNPMHANIANPVLWVISGDVVCQDWGKVGSFRQKVKTRIKNPAWVGSAKESRVRVLFAILCAEAVYDLWYKYDKQDKKVLVAIKTAKKFVCNAAYAAADDAYAAAAAVDAYAAADDAYAAVHAHAAAACAAHAAAYAAHAAVHAHAAAAGAAYAAAAIKIDFAKLADQAVRQVV